MNEWYARDISKKIRSTFQAKGKAGRHLTGTVIYGYLWDKSRRHWLVDEEAAAVVRRIFAMSMDGYGPYQIARRLSAEKVEIPSIHLARHGEGVNKNKAVKDPLCLGFVGHREYSQKAGVPRPYHQLQDTKALQGQEKPLCP